jgi:hypothetical protein
MVGVVTTLIGRLVSQDAALLNAAQAATRLQHRRREHDDVTRFLAASQLRRRTLGDVGDSGLGRRTSTRPP